jgi:small neutral amino acid transporter SnatA (MarC family)
MRIIWYLLAVLLGAFGVLGLVRSAERIATGAGASPIQILIGLVGLLLAWLCIRKARSIPSA